MTVLFSCSWTSRSASMSSVISEIPKRTLSYAIGCNVISISLSKISVSLTSILTCLGKILSPVASRTHSHTFMGGGVSEGSLTDWTVRNATSSKVVSKWPSRTCAYTESRSILCVGTLGAPNNTSTCKLISVVVNSRIIETGTGSNAEHGWIIWKLST